ncbi:NAD-dependent epimerase/dehydratase family protein [Microbacterium lacus]|uniref:NAD-dependent epimerase/dehydratase family protein n=1 Tax=Microbacterium lacus TaxID=415217 RepID=UPI000C2B5A1D|nr:NAD-dependent epimerase/dehydratase family protein [Microbacterium lacus]
MPQNANAPRVIVTGASGYIGRHVVSALLDRGCRVLAVARTLPPADIDPRAETCEIDVLDINADVDPLFADSRDILVHLAWQDGFSHQAPSHMLTLSSHFRFLTEAAKRVSRLAVLGTMHEIGYWEGGVTAETPTNPRSLYGIAKDALRRSLFLASSNETELCWLRSYYIYGDDRRNKSIFTRLLDAEESGQASIPFTMGRQKYDFIHVRDLAEQIAVVAMTPGISGILNTSSGVPVALAEKVELFIEENGLNVRLDYGAFPERAYDSPAIWGVADDVRQLVSAARASHEQ